MLRKRIKSTIPALLFAFAAEPLTTLADIQLCDGRWTNIPCTGQSQELAQKQSSVLSPVEARELSEKKSIFHDLTMLSLKAKREHDIRYSLESARTICFESANSIEDCRKRIEEDTERLDEKIERAEAKQLKERELEVKADKNEEPKVVQATTVNIIQPRIIRRRPNYDRYPPYGPHYPAGNGSSTITSSGGSISITAQGNNVSVGGTVGGGVIEERHHNTISGWVTK